MLGQRFCDFAQASIAFPVLLLQGANHSAGVTEDVEVMEVVLLHPPASGQNSATEHGAR